MKKEKEHLVTGRDWLILASTMGLAMILLSFGLSFGQKAVDSLHLESYVLETILAWGMLLLTCIGAAIFKVFSGVSDLKRRIEKLEKVNPQTGNKE